MDTAEFERLYRTSRSKALSFATRLTKGDRDLAEDLVQKALLDLWRAIFERATLTIESDGHFLALTYQHVRWGFLQHHQLFRTRNELLGILDDWAAIPESLDRIDNLTPAASAEDVVMATVLDEDVATALDRVPARARQAVELRHLAQRNAGEVRDAMGYLSEHVAQNEITEGMTRLRGEYVAITGAAITLRNTRPARAATLTRQERAGRRPTQMAEHTDMQTALERYGIPPGETVRFLAADRPCEASKFHSPRPLLTELVAYGRVQLVLCPTCKDLVDVFLHLARCTPQLPLREFGNGIRAIGLDIIRRETTAPGPAEPRAS